MSIYLLILAIVGTLFSLVMGIFVYRQIHKSRWIDARAVTIFWIFLAIVLLLVATLWVFYTLSLQHPS